MLTYYKCEVKRENTGELCSVAVYSQQDWQHDWSLQVKKHCMGLDYAQEVAEQERKARGIADFAWKTIIDTREVTQ